MTYPKKRGNLSSSRLTHNVSPLSVGGRTSSQTQLPEKHTAVRGGGKLKIHNADLFVETMQTNDWAAPKYPTTAITQGGKIVHTDAGMEASIERQRSQVERQREAFMEKQSVKEHEFKQKFEVAKREAERKTKERTNQKEKDFEERFERFVRDNSSLVEEVDGAIRADEQWRQRKKERLFDEWSVKVFQPMQDKINEHVSAMTMDEMESRRRYMFQAFLDESNKKTNGLFRDIIIESDYDPMLYNKTSTFRYQAASMADDPTKNRSTREQGDSMVKYLLASKPQEEEKKRRVVVPVEMWANMEATPYGRYSKEEQEGIRKPKNDNFLRSDVCLDHYHVAKGDEGRRLLKHEAGVRGKKMDLGRVGCSSQVTECLRSPAEATPGLTAQRQQRLLQQQLVGGNNGTPTEAPE